MARQAGGRQAEDDQDDDKAEVLPACHDRVVCPHHFTAQALLAPFQGTLMVALREVVVDEPAGRPGLQVLIGAQDIRRWDRTAGTACFIAREFNRCGRQRSDAGRSLRRGGRWDLLRWLLICPWRIVGPAARLWLRGWCLLSVWLHARPYHVHGCADGGRGVSCATTQSVLLRKRDVIALTAADVKEAAYAHQEWP